MEEPSGEYSCDNRPTVCEVEESNEFISRTEDLSVLEDEFSGNDAFLTQIADLRKICSTMRHVKKDGCCFYRCFSFGFFEYLVKHKTEIENLKSHLIITCKNMMKDAGYTMYTVDDFLEEFVSCMNQIESPESSIKTVEFFLNDICTANFIVVLLRLITASYMKLHSDLFQGYLVNYKDIDSYCRSEVEPMWVEADNLHIIALTRALDVPIGIYCIDAVSRKLAGVQVFPHETKTPWFHLLYRPGHYELIYPK